MSVGELAHYMKVSVDHLRYWQAKGAFHPVEVGGKYFFPVGNEYGRPRESVGKLFARCCTHFSERRSLEWVCATEEIAPEEARRFYLEWSAPLDGRAYELELARVQQETERLREVGKQKQREHETRMQRLHDKARKQLETDLRRRPGARR